MPLTLTSRATVYDRYSIARRFTAQETAINVVKGNISLLVSESEITELKNGDKTMYSKLASVEMDLKSITLAVSSSEYKDINGVLSAITQARASITLNSQQIQLKVSKDSVISSINQTAEAVKINANKIELTGNGVIDILNTGTTTINASRINLNGVVTANQNFKILSDGSMEAKNGTFDGNVTVDTFRLKSGKLTIDTGTLEISNPIYDYASLTISSGGATFDAWARSIRLQNGSNNIISHSIGTNAYSYWKYGSKMCSINLSSSDCTLFLSNGSGGAVTLIGGGTSRFSDVMITGTLGVTGTKNRVVKTQSFGTIAQSAYETAEPMFGDVGHGIINEYGECTIFMDPKFAETVSTEYGYYVFITKYSDGDAWVSLKELNTFTISGTPGLEFDWELKAHQKGYETDRLKTVELPDMNSVEARARP